MMWNLENSVMNGDRFREGVIPLFQIETSHAVSVEIHSHTSHFIRMIITV